MQRYGKPITRNPKDLQDICPDLINFDIRQTNVFVNEESNTSPQCYEIKTDTRTDTSSDSENISTGSNITDLINEICIMESDGFDFAMKFSDDYINTEVDFFESDDFMVDGVNGFFDEAPW